MSIMYANSTSTINIMFNFMFNIFLITCNNYPKQWHNFFQECFEMFAFCKQFISALCRRFISVKTTSPHKDNFSAERIRNSGAQFFCVSCWDFMCHTTTMKKHAPHDTFFKNHELNRVTEISLSYIQNIPIYCPSGEYKFSVRFFLDYWYTIVFVQYCAPQNDVWWMIQMCTKFCSALNLTIIFIKPFTCNNTNFILL